MTFDSKRMKVLRQKLIMTQRILAAKVGVPYQRIQEYEWGKTEPKGSRLALIADALETNVDYLLGRTNYPDKLSDLHYQVSDAFDRGDSDAIIVLLRKHLFEQGIGKKPIARRKPGPAK